MVMSCSTLKAGVFFLMAGKMRSSSFQRAGLVFIRAGKMISYSFQRADVFFISLLWHIQLDLVLARTTRIFRHGRIFSALWGLCLHVMVCLDGKRRIGENILEGLLDGTILIGKIMTNC